MNLDNMLAEWDELKFIVMEHKDTYKLGGFDDI